jgi:hypothetical protein
MEPHILSIEIGTAIQILDGVGDDNFELDARVREARDEAYATKSTVVVIGGARASTYAGLVIAFVDGQPKIVKNRRGPTDNA